MTRSSSPPEPFEADPETLALFVDETREGLARVERLLLAAEQQAAPPDMLSILFRELHTIKGTSAFLALPQVLKLAHTAEDLLGELRELGQAPSAAHLNQLMAVVDLLRQLVQNLRECGDEGDFDVGPLVAELQESAAAVSASGEADSFRAPTQPSAPVPAAPPAVVAPTAPPPPAPAPAPVSPPTAPPVNQRKNAAAFIGGDQGLAAMLGGDEVVPVDDTVRVPVGVLDRLMMLMGELVLARNQTIRLVQAQWNGETALAEACNLLRQVTAEMQEQILKTRMQPVARVLDDLPRLVRDLCRSTGKRVACHIEGATIEIDKALVEAIRDPVIHLVRNAIDHGIEVLDVRLAQRKLASGRLNIRARHESGSIKIEVEDDGRGLDPQRLRDRAVERHIIDAAEGARLTDSEARDLIFRPGFSTADKVSEISGRGVGLDVVLDRALQLGGQVEIDSEPGQGTTVRLTLPLTLAIIPALLVDVRGQRFAIPQNRLLDLAYLPTIEHVRDAEVYRWRGEILPLVRLGNLLKLTGKSPSAGHSIVVVMARQRRYGLVVDGILDTEEIVHRSLHSQLQILCYTGATVLGDGSPVLILDVQGIATMAGIDAAIRAPRTDDPVADKDERTQPFVVFESGDKALLAVPSRMVARLEKVPRQAIEVIGSNEMVQYHGSILPIVRPESVLSIGPPSPDLDEQPLVVFDFGHRVGLAVNKILDIADLTPADEGGESSPFGLGKAVTLGRTVLLLDVYQLVRKAAPGFVFERRREQRNSRLLVVDDSVVMRASLSGFLRTCGFAVVEAASGDAALEELRAQPGRFDGVVTDLEMAGLDGLGLVSVLKREKPELPTFVWTYLDDPAIAPRVLAAGARACVHKLRREELVSALQDSGLGGGRRQTDTGRAG